MNNPCKIRRKCEVWFTRYYLVYVVIYYKDLSCYNHYIIYRFFFPDKHRAQNDYHPAPSSFNACFSYARRPIDPLSLVSPAPAATCANGTKASSEGVTVDTSNSATAGSMSFVASSNCNLGNNIYVYESRN